LCSLIFYSLEQVEEEEEESGGSRLNQRKEKKKKKKKGDVDSEEEEDGGVDGLKNKMHKGTPEVRIQFLVIRSHFVLFSLCYSTFAPKTSSN